MCVQQIRQTQGGLIIGVRLRRRRHICCASVDEIIDSLLEVVDDSLSDLIVLDTNFVNVIRAKPTYGDILGDHLGASFGFRANLSKVGVERVPKFGARVLQIGPPLQKIELDPWQ
jgi:hypothetical protein